MTKNSPAQATGAHISIIGNVVQEELQRYLSSTEAGNGFANRFLWIYVQRSKYLADGGNLTDNELAPLADQVKEAVEHAHMIGELKRDLDARDRWYEVYPQLSEGSPGIVGAVTSRSEAQVMRLALIYALMDGSSRIGVPHLKAALAFWDYCEESARYIFGDAVGDPVADAILEAVRSTTVGMSRTDLHHLFKRNVKVARINTALATLERRQFIVAKMESVSVGKGGRPRKVWFAREHLPAGEGNEGDEVTSASAA